MSGSRFVKPLDRIARLNETLSKARATVADAYMTTATCITPDVPLETHAQLKLCVRRLRNGMISAEDRTSAHLRHFNTYEMLTTPVHIQVRTGVNTGVFAEEMHTRFTQPLFALAAVLLGFASLLSGGFSRFGVWRQIVIALILLILIKALESVVTEPVLSNSSLWPLLYLPALLGLTIAIALLARSAGQLPSLSAWRRRKAVIL